MDNLKLEYGPPEDVLVENDWYDGPRSGICYVDNVLHRFQSNFDEEDDYLGTFRIAPICSTLAELEVEQWKIFVDWNKGYEAGDYSTDQHPGNGGIHDRFDEIESLLRDKREVPVNAQLAKALFVRKEERSRYNYEGTDYQFRWCKIESANNDA